MGIHFLNYLQQLSGTHIATNCYTFDKPREPVSQKNMLPNSRSWQAFPNRFICQETMAAVSI